MSKIDRSKTAHREPAAAIIEAIAQLQSAFLNAGLLEPVALVVAGEEQRRLLDCAFARYLMMAPNHERPWEGTTIRGMKVIYNVAA